MSRNEEFHAARLYHGTQFPFQDGDIVRPARDAGVKANWGKVHRGIYAHATEHFETAKYFAATAGSMLDPHYVYEVEPVDHRDVLKKDLQEDPNSDPVIEHRSASGFRVKRKIWEGPEK